MKITDLEKREDIYSICEQTINTCFTSKNEQTRMYIYPHLNAIVTKKPSKSVKDFLYTEYNVSGNFFKKILVKVYVWLMLNSFGCFAKGSFQIKDKIDSSCLIYPCNKKIRIFDFDKGIVRVVVKAGFPLDCIKNEIIFRQSEKENFIHPIISFDESSYTEKIIDGFPVARAGKKQAYYAKKAYTIWENYYRKHISRISSVEYAHKLEEESKSLINKLEKRGFKIDTDTCNNALKILFTTIKNFDEDIDIAYSHGDLQAGNIWIERKTNRIILIDWESFDIRSVWYDYALLFGNIRDVGGLVCYYNNHKGVESSTVLAEDFIFKLKEYEVLPDNCNCEQINDYFSVIYRYLSE